MGVERVEDTFVVEGVEPQACWDYLVDMDNVHEWNTFTKRAEALDPPGLGRRVRAEIGFVGITFPITVEVTRWDEPERFAIGATSPFRTELGMRLRDVDAGTEMTAWLEADPGRFFPVPGFVLRRALRSQFDRDVALTRRQLEQLA